MVRYVHVLGKNSNFALLAQDYYGYKGIASTLFLNKWLIISWKIQRLNCQQLICNYDGHN